MSLHNFTIQKNNFSLIIEQISHTEDTEQLIKIGSDYSQYAAQLINYRTQNQNVINNGLQRKINTVITSAQQSEKVCKIEETFQTIHPVSSFDASKEDLEKLLSDNANELLQFVEKADKKAISLLLSIPKFAQYLLGTDFVNPSFRNKQKIAEILVHQHSELLLNPQDIEHSLIQYTLEHVFNSGWFLELFSNNQFSNAAIRSLITVFIPAMVTSKNNSTVFFRANLQFIAKHMQSMPLELLEECFKIEINQQFPRRLLLTEILKKHSSDFDSLTMEKKNLIFKFISNSTAVAFFVFVRWKERLEDILEKLNNARYQLPLFFKHYLSTYDQIPKKSIEEFTESELITFIQDYAFVYVEYKKDIVKAFETSPEHEIWKRKLANLENSLPKAILSILFSTIDSSSLTDYAEVLSKHIRIHGIDGLLPCITGRMSFIEYLAQRSEWADPSSAQLLDLAITYRCSFTVQALDWAIAMQNRTMLKKLAINGMLPTLSRYERIPILNRLADSQNKDFLQLFLDYIGDAKDADLEKMIEKRQTLAIKFFLDNGYRFYNAQLGQQLLNKAIQSYNVECICLIFENLQKQFPTYSITFPNLFPNDTEENTKDRLLRFALVSPLSTLKQVIDTHYSHLALRQWLEEMADILALQVRLPVPYSTNNLSEIKNFVDVNRTYLNDLVPKLPQLSWPQFLEECLEKRKKNPDKHSSEKLVMRIHAKRQHLYTSLAVSLENYLIEKVYMQAWHQAHILTADLPYDHSLLSKSGDHVVFFYRLPNKKLVKVTHLYTEETLFPQKLYWYHAETAVIKKCQAHLNSLHRRVIEFILTKDNQQEFEKLVAECYWLMTSLAETSRGAAHNAKLWLMAVYRYHSLPPPIPKLEYFFLDTMMMCMTVDQAIVLWPQFFEESITNVP